tara:strand:+ start:728 stop:1060 length:333 start_codon:yes stop_codon:yes gene_type:complete
MVRPVLETVVAAVVHLRQVLQVQAAKVRQTQVEMVQDSLFVHQIMALLVLMEVVDTSVEAVVPVHTDHQQEQMVELVEEDLVVGIQIFQNKMLLEQTQLETLVVVAVAAP